ncbi:hypothetical protein [Paenibacillus lemnae]|uniref:Uncharacterized protein n=1 Tax=Paenibacillus lemnae TaxID=1330551 RepID=A0A848M3M2_PAELE|nr:hypothetical protein [Paenibacillus lemnae]NMO95547.1 hypothetical protein [Paenibacillus lemnae]
MKKNNNNGNGEVVQKSEDQGIIDKAKTIAVKHLRDEYELDVEITGEKLLPQYINIEVILEGNVIGNKEQHFSISVNYQTNETFNFGMSPELVAAIRANGYDPYEKK